MRWLALAFALLSACARAPGPTDRLVVYSAGPRGLAEKVCEAFTAASGVPVDLFQATTGQLMARLEAERYRPRADVVLFASEVAAEALKQDGRLLAHTPPPGERRADWSDPDGFYHGSSASLVGLAVRADSPSLPESWSGLLRHRGGGRLVMPSPSRSGTSGDFVVAWFLREGEKALEDFLHARGNGLEFAAANNQAIGGLALGAYDGILGAADYLIYAQIARGEALRMVFPAEEAVLVTRPLAILSGARNPEAAKAFVDFYFEPAAQALVAKAYLLPARLDVPPSPLRGDTPEGWIRADVKEAVRQQSAILRRFQLRVERAVVLRSPEKSP